MRQLTLKQAVSKGKENEFIESILKNLEINDICTIPCSFIVDKGETEIIITRKEFIEYLKYKVDKEDFNKYLKYKVNKENEK